MPVSLLRSRLFLPGALLATTALAAPGAAAADLALKRVMLSSAGVGYFEYSAEVDGPATLGLDVPLDEVDDVLKSLVVFDDAGGVGGIELPGRDQSHSAFGDVPFGPDGLGSALAFLNSLQGVEVTVQGPRPMSGRILQAETVHEPVGPAGKDGAPASQDRTRVSVLTADGLKQFVLEDSDAVQVTDPGLRERIGRALAALRHESGQDARHIAIRSNGAGHRTVRVSYVAVAPLWKASYRLVLPPQGSGPAPAKARMQGWATLENASGTDWSGVALTVQYGNPVTFHQAIYRSYFVARPEVPVEVLGRLLPDVDSRARQTADADEPPAPPPPPAPAPMMSAQRALRPAGAAADDSAMKMAPPSEAAAASEGAEETVFAIPTPITLAAGHSASVPILDREIPAERLDLAHAGEANPLAVIRIRNDTAESIPAGVLTLYDAQAAAPYAGDARLGGLPAGESRLLSFAQDLRTSLEWRSETAVTVAALTVAAGVLTLDERNRQLTHVTLTGPRNEPRHVLLEVAKSPDAAVPGDFAQPVEETATAWRFAVDLKPGETREVTLAVDRTRRQSIGVLNDPNAIARVLNLQGTSDAARAALGRVTGLRVQEAARASELAQLKTQLQAVEKEEDRLRANLASVPAGDALHSRLVRQLDADETRIGQLQTSIDAAGQAVAKAHGALVDAIATLRI